MKRILLIACLVGLLAALFGCGGDKSETEESKDSEKPAIGVKPEASTAQYVPEGGRSRFEGKGYTEEQIDELMDIEKLMTEALVRWSYHDKSVLYENEFEAIHAKYSIGEYLRHYRIMAANGADSVVGFYVTGGTFYNHDSVLVDDVVIFIGPTGQRTDFVNKDMLYWHGGRWIRPTISTMQTQLDYEALVRQADSAAAAEEDY